MNTETEVRRDLIEKYFNALTQLKTEMDNNSILSMREFEVKHKVNSKTITALRNLNVVRTKGVKQGITYSWNDKIPVTKLLAKKVILENRRIQRDITERMKGNNSVDGRRLNGGARVNAGRKRKNTVKTDKPKKVNDVGLIRRFFRWIY